MAGLNAVECSLLPILGIKPQLCSPLPIAIPTELSQILTSTVGRNSEHCTATFGNYDCLMFWPKDICTCTADFRVKLH
jgi:hypothetical protein